MEFQTYPRWKYSVAGGVIVNDAEAEAALGDGWYNFPDEVEQAAKDKAAADALALEEDSKDLDSLRAAATDIGIVVDGRWKAPRLEQEIKDKILANGPAADAPITPATEA